MEQNLGTNDTRKYDREFQKFIHSSKCTLIPNIYKSILGQIYKLLRGKSSILFFSNKHEKKAK